jgi:hypothetical protein
MIQIVFSKIMLNKLSLKFKQTLKVKNIMQFITKTNNRLKYYYMIFMMHVLPDKMFIKCKYRLLHKKRLRLKHPKLFTEKLQWIKLYDRKPIYHKMVDKIEMKKFVSDLIGPDYVIPTLGIWNHPEEIDLESLPKKFILKNTFDSGTYSICTDKENFDLAAAKQRLLKTWKYDYSIYSREWPYRGLEKRTFAEPLIDDGKGDYLTDYKIYTFNGEPKLMYITSNRGSKDGLCIDFYDEKGQHVEISQRGYNNNPNTPQLPVHYQEMLGFARILSKDTYHLRVDFYEIGDKIYVGELTFFDGGGFFKFNDEKYDELLGSWIHLPIDSKE